MKKLTKTQINKDICTYRIKGKFFNKCTFLYVIDSIQTYEVEEDGKCYQVTTDGYVEYCANIQGKKEFVNFLYLELNKKS